MNRQATADSPGPQAAEVAALQAQALEFSYGQQPALNQVSIEVPPGKFVVLIGANGAGKTTLFSIVTGLYAAHRGTVAIMGRDLRTQTLSALASMGVVFQRTTLDLDLSVRQNLHYAAALQGIPTTHAKTRIEASLQQHGLAGLEQRKAASLSGGQRRRVELARALLHQPQLLLLDEPTVGLDLQSRGEFVDHVKNLCAQRGTGVLWATHLMDEVAADDLVYVMDRGEVVANGQLDALLRKFDAPDIETLFRRLLGSAEA